MNLSNKNNKNVVVVLRDFFFVSFYDWENGGEFLMLEGDNSPIKKENKGSPGQSDCHTSAQLGFLIENQKQLFNKTLVLQE